MGTKLIATLLAFFMIFLAVVQGADAGDLQWMGKWPVPYGRITSTVGWRNNPFNPQERKWHNGIDIALPAGSPVTPTASGTVYYSGWHAGGYGNLVVVQHAGGGWFSLYGHCSKLFAKVGDRVDENTTIALVGSTGRSTGDHIHFETRYWPAAAEQWLARMQEESTYRQTSEPERQAFTRYGIRTVDAENFVD